MTTPARILRSVEAVIRHRYPGHDVLTRRVGYVWSAEVVVPGQQQAPYRTVIIAEAETPDALLALVEGRADAELPA